MHRRQTAWRIVASSLLALVVLASLGVVSAQPSARQTSATTGPIKPTRQFTVSRKGILDLSKAPTIKAGDKPASGPPPSFDPMTPQQRAAYEANARKGIGVPPAPTAQKSATTAPGLTSNFVGGGPNPLLVKQFDGLNSTQAGNVAAPDVTIATDLSYVMEGVNNAVGIYRTSTGALAYGPYSADTFFAPVKIPGDTFGRPQMYYDVMRDRWIVLWMEYTAVGSTYHSYIDIAISTSNSPTQPAPGAQYYEYREPMYNAVNGNWCYQATLGVEYYTLTLGCTMLTPDNTYFGNSVLLIQKGPMITGSTTYSQLWEEAVQTADNFCNGTPCPAFYVSPAIEEGVQDAEFLIGTATGYGGTHSQITLCALTNLANLTTQLATLSCTQLSFISYSDPVAPEQPGGGLLQPERGLPRVYYKAGHLFFALSSAFTGPKDGVIWAELTPRLQPSLDYSQYENTGVMSGSANTYYFAPVLIGSDEDDLALVYNISEAYDIWLAYTGRKASDLANSMDHGGNASSIVVMNGNGHPSGTWDGYSACAIALNSVTRGTIWCVGEYQGSVADPGWNTRIFSLRVE